MSMGQCISGPEAATATVTRIAAVNAAVRSPLSGTALDGSLGANGSTYRSGPARASCHNADGSHGGSQASGSKHCLASDTSRVRCVSDAKHAPPPPRQSSGAKALSIVKATSAKDLSSSRNGDTSAAAAASLRDWAVESVGGAADQFIVDGIPGTVAGGCGGGDGGASGITATTSITVGGAAAGAVRARVARRKYSVSAATAAATDTTASFPLGGNVDEEKEGCFEENKQRHDDVDRHDRDRKRPGIEESAAVVGHVSGDTSGEVARLRATTLTRSAITSAVTTASPRACRRPHRGGNSGQSLKKSHYRSSMHSSSSSKHSNSRHTHKSGSTTIHPHARLRAKTRAMKAPLRTASALASHASAESLDEWVMDSSTASGTAQSGDTDRHRVVNRLARHNKNETVRPLKRIPSHMHQKWPRQQEPEQTQQGTQSLSQASVPLAAATPSLTASHGCRHILLGSDATPAATTGDGMWGVMGVSSGTGTVAGSDRHSDHSSTGRGSAVSGSASGHAVAAADRNEGSRYSGKKSSNRSSHSPCFGLGGGVRAPGISQRHSGASNAIADLLGGTPDSIRDAPPALLRYAFALGGSRLDNSPLVDVDSGDTDSSSTRTRHHPVKSASPKKANITTPRKDGSAISGGRETSNLACGEDTVSASARRATIPPSLYTHHHGHDRYPGNSGSGSGASDPTSNDDNARATGAATAPPAMSTATGNGTDRSHVDSNVPPRAVGDHRIYTGITVNGARTVYGSEQALTPRAAAPAAADATPLPLGFERPAHSLTSNLYPSQLIDLVSIDEELSLPQVRTGQRHQQREGHCHSRDSTRSDSSTTATTAGSQAAAAAAAAITASLAADPVQRQALWDMARRLSLASESAVAAPAAAAAAAFGLPSMWTRGCAVNSTTLMGTGTVTITTHTDDIARTRTPAATEGAPVAATAMGHGADIMDSDGQSAASNAHRFVASRTFTTLRVGPLLRDGGNPTAVPIVIPTISIVPLLDDSGDSSGERNGKRGHEAPSASLAHKKGTKHTSSHRRSPRRSRALAPLATTTATTTTTTTVSPGGIAARGGRSHPLALANTHRQEPLGADHGNIHSHCDSSSRNSSSSNSRGAGEVRAPGVGIDAARDALPTALSHPLVGTTAMTDAAGPVSGDNGTGIGNECGTGGPSSLSSEGRTSYHGHAAPFAVRSRDGQFTGHGRTGGAIAFADTDADSLPTDDTGSLTPLTPVDAMVAVDMNSRQTGGALPILTTETTTTVTACSTAVGSAAAYTALMGPTLRRGERYRTPDPGATSTPTIERSLTTPLPTSALAPARPHDGKSAQGRLPAATAAAHARIAASPLPAVLPVTAVVAENACTTATPTATAPALAAAKSSCMRRQSTTDSSHRWDSSRNNNSNNSNKISSHKNSNDHNSPHRNHSLTDIDAHADLSVSSPLAASISMSHIDASLTAGVANRVSTTSRRESTFDGGRSTLTSASNSIALSGPPGSPASHAIVNSPCVSRSRPRLVKVHTDGSSGGGTGDCGCASCCAVPSDGSVRPPSLQRVVAVVLESSGCGSGGVGGGHTDAGGCGSANSASGAELSSLLFSPGIVRNSSLGFAGTPNGRSHSRVQPLKPAPPP